MGLIRRFVEDERGLIATQILVIYIVFLLTIMGGLFIFAIGLMKNGRANYLWFAEALEYAAHAANETGGLYSDGDPADPMTIRLNQRKARMYFEEAMREFGIDYRLISFSTVNTGGSVPNGARAMAPGYLAAVEVKVLDAHVPLVGHQEIWIPMRYFAVVRSHETED